MRKSYMPMMPIIFLFATLFSWMYFPAISSTLGMIALLFSLVLSAHAIVHKHKGTENARPKILKEAGLLVLTLILVIFLAGIAAMLANYQVSIRWGEAAGFVSAVAVSFAVGYWVRKRMAGLTGE